jgi:PadR family transcriptional regulator PadR
MAFKSDIKALILAALQGEALHGYEIVKRIRETGAAGRLSEGQIYPYLHELEAANMLTAEWQTDTGGAPRRVYQITPEGRAELDRQRALWTRFVRGVGSMLAANATSLEGGNV